MRRARRLALLLGLALLAAVGGSVTRAAVSPPSPGGFVDGSFCTHDKDYFSTSTEVAQLIQGGLPFSIGASPNTYSWTNVTALQQAVGTGGSPGAFSTNATNPTDMGTGGNLATQTLAESINLNFSERVVTPTGFQPLSLVEMNGVRLSGDPLTPAQASALNGQAAVQVREAANVALGRGTLPYGLSFDQLTDLIRLLNISFSESYTDANGVVHPCGHPSKFAQTHLYKPYVTSNAFAGQRPVSISLFAPKPQYSTFSGEVVHVGRGCPGVDSYLAKPRKKIALIERGLCRFDNKVARAQKAGAIGVIVYNNSAGGEALVGLGGDNPVAQGDASVIGTTVTIPAVFVQRSTGLLLREGTPPVTAFVQQ
jgi:PA domain